MFKHLFHYWFNPTDTPNILSKLNIWFYINIRLFKLKISSVLYYFILNLNKLNLKNIKVMYKNLKYEYIYLYNMYILFIILVLTLL
jgi:hypothetical protein